MKFQCLNKRGSQTEIEIKRSGIVLKTRKPKFQENIKGVLKRTFGPVSAKNRVFSQNPWHQWVKYPSSYHKREEVQKRVENGENREARGSVGPAERRWISLLRPCFVESYMWNAVWGKCRLKRKLFITMHGLWRCFEKEMGNKLVAMWNVERAIHWRQDFRANESVQNHWNANSHGR